jgi:hypothetical protein
MPNTCYKSISIPVDLKNCYFAGITSQPVLILSPVAKCAPKQFPSTLLGQNREKIPYR